MSSTLRSKKPKPKARLDIDQQVRRLDRDRIRRELRIEREIKRLSVALERQVKSRRDRLVGLTRFLANMLDMRVEFRTPEPENPFDKV